MNLLFSFALFAPPPSFFFLNQLLLILQKAFLDIPNFELDSHMEYSLYFYNFNTYLTLIIFSVRL